jgi:hypothetical protein
MRKLALAVTATAAVAVGAPAAADALTVGPVSLGPGLTATLTAGAGQISVSVLSPDTAKILTKDAHSSSCTIAVTTTARCTSTAPIFAGTATQSAFTNVVANAHVSTLGLASMREEQIVYNPYTQQYVTVVVNTCTAAFGCHEQYTIDYANHGALATTVYDTAVATTAGVPLTLSNSLKSTKVAGGQGIGL